MGWNHHLVLIFLQIAGGFTVVFHATILDVAWRSWTDAAKSCAEEKLEMATPYTKQDMKAQMSEENAGWLRFDNVG